jgi:hypothetical protein
MYLKAGTQGINKLNPRWEKGIWLGVRDETGEIVVGTPEGVIKARDLKRLPPGEERWNSDGIASVKGTPWEPVPGRAADTIPVRVRLAEEECDIAQPSIGEPKEEIKRRAIISREDVVKVGFTVGCPGCSAISRKARAENHTEACRLRIEKALIESGGAKAKQISDGIERFDEHMAKKMRPEGRPGSSSDGTNTNKSDSTSTPSTSTEPGTTTVKKRPRDSTEQEQSVRKYQAQEEDDVEETNADTMIELIKHANYGHCDARQCNLDADNQFNNFVCSVEHTTREFWDDLSGKELVPSLVMKARTEEIGELAKHGVYQKVPITECWNKTGAAPIGTRWVDVNKGDDEHK